MSGPPHTVVCQGCYLRRLLFDVFEDGNTDGTSVRSGLQRLERRLRRVPFLGAVVERTTSRENRTKENWLAVSPSWSGHRANTVDEKKGKQVPMFHKS